MTENQPEAEAAGTPKLVLDEQTGEMVTKNELKKREKQRKKDEQKAQVAAAQAAQQYKPPKLTTEQLKTEDFGDMPLHQSQEGIQIFQGVQTEIFPKVGPVTIRTYLQNSRCTGKTAFLTLRQQQQTIQAVLFDEPEKIKYIKSIPKESYVQITGQYEQIEEPVKTCTIQLYEIKIEKVYCITRAMQQLPLLVEDAMRPDSDVSSVKPNRETLLDQRVIDLRTPANKAIFKIRAIIQQAFSAFMIQNQFLQITTPKINPGASEGGADVFKLEYFGSPACLAQSPQLYKQMAIASGFQRVFEIGPVFRAEASHTHRHLCEFTGLDLEMEIKESYREVQEVLDKLMKHIFRSVLDNCKEEMASIYRQYDVHVPEQLIWTDEMVLIDFKEGCKMLQEKGIDQAPDKDLSTETERALGAIVREKYHTDFYILDKFPTSARPFYTMVDIADPNYSNSFDMFIRGQEICSGAQRIHDPEFLRQQIIGKGIDPETLKDYIQAFKYGCPPHGGAGLGLERIIMLTLAIEDCRQCCLFPRTPERCSP